MRKFVRRALVPPSGYFYIVPETGIELVAGSFDTLVVIVRQHYTLNRLECPRNLAELIEHFLCLHNVPSLCQGEYTAKDKQAQIITARQISEFTRLIFHRLRGGKALFMAAPADAARRAQTCVTCAENYRGMCTTCNGLREFAARLVNTRETPFDHLLGVCSRCSCLLRAKIHVSSAALRTITSDADLTKYPENCWMHEITKVKPGGGSPDA